MAAVQMSIISSHGGRARSADRKQALCVDAAAPSGSRGHEVDPSRGGAGVKCITDADREVSFELFYTVNCIVGNCGRSFILPRAKRCKDEDRGCSVAAAAACHILDATYMM